MTSCDQILFQHVDNQDSQQDLVLLGLFCCLFGFLFVFLALTESCCLFLLVDLFARFMQTGCLAMLNEEQGRTGTS